MFDLLDAVLIGTNMIPLGLTALLLLRMRSVVFREHMMAQAIMTLIALVIFSILSTIFRTLLGSRLEGDSAWAHLGHLLVDSIYTAILAPFLFWVFFRFPQMLGFTSQRSRSHR